MNSNTAFYLVKEGRNVINKRQLADFVRQNPSLKKFLQRIPLQLRLLPYPFFESLCYWIIHQQISGQVANRMVARFRAAFKEIQPRTMLDTPPEKLLALGLSRAKSQYIQNVAEFFLEHHDSIHQKAFTSKEAIDFFTQIKGIGEWTMQMHLIFGWGHLDVLAAKDLVVRQGVQILYGQMSLPTEKEVKQLCQHWGELATIGTLLAWAVKGE